MYPQVSSASPLSGIQTAIHAVQGVGDGLLNALHEDSTGRAQNHVVAAVECLIRLERSLKLWDNVTDKIEKVRGLEISKLGKPLDGVDNGLGCMVNVSALQEHVEEVLTKLVEGFSDILSRGECPLLQTNLCADVLADRLRKLR